MLINTAAVSDNIRDIEKALNIPDLIAEGTVSYGMQSFDQSLMKWYKDGIVSYESALFYSSNPSEFALRASPTGFPFKVVQLEGTMSSDPVYQSRERVCDLGYLRTAYRMENGRIGYRCPAEPVDTYVAKGGVLEETIGRKCLCNALMADVGVGQVRDGGEVERRRPAHAFCASATIRPSSPDSDNSTAISQPPISSPLMKSCGNVGQSE